MRPQKIFFRNSQQRSIRNWKAYVITVKASAFYVVIAGAKKFELFLVCQGSNNGERQYDVSYDDKGFSVVL